MGEGMKYKIACMTQEYEQSNFEDVTYKDWSELFYKLLIDILEGMEDVT
jgi:hypothetical protein